MFRFFVGNAVPSATFNDLANMSAKLGNYFWLGFIITGLPPDKKRHALHGAQRQSLGNPLREPHSDTQDKVLIMIKIRLGADSGVAYDGLFSDFCEFLDVVVTD